MIAGDTANATELVGIYSAHLSEVTLNETNILEEMRRPATIYAERRAIGSGKKVGHFDGGKGATESVAGWSKTTRL